jgi:hypothetical protein
MKNADFFQADQEAWFTEFVDAEVREIREAMSTQPEFFEFEDVPF